MSLAIASTSRPLIVWDDAYDHDRASDGFSRFGGYLAQRLPAVVHNDPDVLCDPVRWASFAWATAAPPVMSPGYVEWVDPIEDIDVGWDDGHLGVQIVVRTASPVTLPGWRSWERDCCGNLIEPWSGNRIALSRTTLFASLRGVALPRPTTAVGDRVEVVWAAKKAIRAVAASIDDVLAPLGNLLHTDSGIRRGRGER